MHCSSPQVFNNAAEEGASFLDYDAEECETGLDALFHDMSNTERNGSWLRTWCGVWHRDALTGRRACLVGCDLDTPFTLMVCRVNMGTADELAIDVLINMLSNFSRE
jgi:hypothetical protein